MEVELQIFTFFDDDFSKDFAIAEDIAIVLHMIKCQMMSFNLHILSLERTSFHLIGTMFLGHRQITLAITQLS